MIRNLDFVLRPGASVGVMLPDAVSSENKTRFENLLNSLTDYREQVGIKVVTAYLSVIDVHSLMTYMQVVF